MIYLLIATILFSFTFGLINNQLVTLPSEFVVFIRLLIAGLIFIPFSRFTHNITKPILIGIIQFGIMYLCFIKAFQYLQGNEVAILTTTTPIFVAIFSALLGEKFRPIYIGCILLSVIGAIIIISHNLSFNMLVKGIILMESSNCVFALGQVLWKKYIDDDKQIAIAYLGAALFILPFVMMINSTITLSITQTLSLLYLGILPTGIGFWLWNKGSKKVSYSTLAVMNNLKIPLSILFAVIIFKEYINIPYMILGSILIIVAAYILHKESNV